MVLDTVSSPLILIFSPLLNVPAVWVTCILLDPAPAETAYPSAPLSLPTINPDWLSSSELTLSFNSNAVYVWIS